MTGGDTRRMPRDWTRRMRVVLVTDGRGDVQRLCELVPAAVASGVRAVQIREPGLSARELTSLCEQLRSRTDDARVCWIVNDRQDLVCPGLFDGVHLRQRSLAPPAAREVVGPDALIGVSAHDPAELRGARNGGADYASLSPVLATECKPGAAPIGLAVAVEWTAAAGLPVVWLGGLNAATTGDVSEPVDGLIGLAARGALMRQDTIDVEVAGLSRAAEVAAGRSTAEPRT